MTKARVTPAQVHSRVVDFSKSLSWTLAVSGQHNSGPTYEDLLEWLAASGRDFRKDNRPLRAHVKGVLLLEFGERATMPTLARLRDVTATAILEWIVGRMENTVNDIRIKANKQDYLKAKIKKGFDSRPGIRTGELLGAVKSADVRVQGG